jgi:hypothetical protein
VEDVMIVGFIGAVICWFVSKSILATIIVFYLITGIIKSLSWKSMSPIDVAPLVRGSIVRGIIFWPIITISNFIFDISHR